MMHLAAYSAAKPSGGNIRARRRIRYAFVGTLPLALAACAEAPLDTTRPAGPAAQRIFDLSVPVFAIAAVIFILVEAAIVYAALKFRDRDDDAEPKQIHGNNRLEVLWTIIPALILVGIAVPTVGAIVDLTSAPADAVEIDVIGHQWWFEFSYPEGVTTANVLVVPAGTPIELNMTSKDVVHSFWVPRLAGKRDVIPGQYTSLYFEADEPGAYWGQCAEFCGLSHAKMSFRVQALPPAEYTAWLQDQQRPAVEPPAGSLEAEGRDVFLSRGCIACHNIRGVSEVAGEVPGAPDLTHFASRSVFAGALLSVDSDDDLRDWLANPPAVKSGSFMPNLGLSPDDIAALIAYLRSLE